MKKIYLIIITLLLVLCLTPLAAAPPGEAISSVSMTGLNFVVPGLQADFTKGVSVTPIGGVFGFLPGQSIETPEMDRTTTFYMRT